MYHLIHNMHGVTPRLGKRTAATFRRLAGIALAISLFPYRGIALESGKQVQVSDARAAFSSSILSPIVPTSSPVPVKSEQADAVSVGNEKEGLLSIEIRSINIEGNTIFGDDVLLSLVERDLNRSLSFIELKALAKRVEDYYHDRGYMVARVIIPRQDIGAGHSLRLKVLEGTVDEVKISGNTRFHSDRVDGTLARYDVIRGEPFKLADLERALTGLNNLSGVSVSSTLRAGQNPGSTQVEVSVKEDPRISGTVEVNNFGNDSTGKLRIVPSVSMANLTGRGDELSVFGILSPKSNGLYFGQVNYQTPVGYRGFGVASYVSAGNYQVGGEYEALSIEGDNYAMGLGLTYDWIRNTRTQLNFDAWFELNNKEQDILGVISSKDKIRKLSIGANLDTRNLNGRTYASFHLQQGLGEMLGGMKDDDVLSSRSYANADNVFTKFVGSVTRLQTLRPNLFLIAHFAAQYSLDSLVAGEEIYAGGANSVRGHPESAFAGDDGFILNVETRYSFLPGNGKYQLAAFFDHGEVHTKHPVLGQESWHRISGAGIGLRATPLSRLELRADIAVPVGDRTDESVYFYAQARFRF